MSLGEQICAFLLDINQKVEWLGPETHVCSALVDTVFLFIFKFTYSEIHFHFGVKFCESRQMHTVL